MQVRVEFLGLSRIVSGEREVTLDMEQGSTYRDIVRVLADRYPGMVGNVIQRDLMTLQEPNIFNLNARRMIQAAHMEESPDEHDRIILMSMSAGG
jgi:hypothetical protein